jgi:hypothetical protein
MWLLGSHLILALFFLKDSSALFFFFHFGVLGMEARTWCSIAELYLQLLFLVFVMYYDLFYESDYGG